MSFSFFAKTGMTALVVIIIAGISLRVSTKASLRIRTTMHNELMLHQHRTYKFIDYIKGLSETLLMDEKHLFVFPGAHLSVLADVCLKGHAGQILLYEKLEDAFSKAVVKGYFNKAHKLFVDGGLIPDVSYDKYFQKRPEVDHGSGLLIVT